MPPDARTITHPLAALAAALRAARNPRPRAFTLIELLVAVALLVVVILAIGQVFRTVSRSVRMSNATIEADANARAVMRQFASDVSRIDRDGFLVIRNNVIGNATKSQIAFIASGNHGNRTGGIDPATPASANINATAAHVWYGFGVNPIDLRSSGPNNNAGLAQTNALQLTARSAGATDNSQQEQNVGYLARHVFAMLPANNSADATKILAPGGGIVPAHRDFAIVGPNIDARNGETQANPASGRTSAASVTPAQVMSRIRTWKYQPVNVRAFVALNDATASNSLYYDRKAAMVPPVDTMWINTNVGGNGVSGTGLMPQYDGSDYWFEARYYCYPFKLLRDAREGVDSANAMDLVNGAARMSTVLLKYCYDFRIEWTDGGVDNQGNLRWMGADGVQGLDSLNTWDYVNNRDLDNKPRQWPPLDFQGGRSYGARSVFPPVSDKAPVESTPKNFQPPYSSGNLIWGDQYNAIFSFDNRNQWPKALRVRLTIRMIGTEHANTGGQTYTLPTRSYTQIVWLPQ